MYMDEWVTDVKMKPCNEVSKHLRNVWYQQHLQWWRRRASPPAYCTSCFGSRLVTCCPPKFNKNDFGSAILLNLSKLGKKSFHILTLVCNYSHILIDPGGWFVVNKFWAFIVPVFMFMGEDWEIINK
jgi:hypothetical protein